MKNMCAECGMDLEQDMSIVPATSQKKKQAQIAIVHSIPELKVSSQVAQNLGMEDEKRLLKHRRLVLLVDLDQTLIHTTNENIPANMRDVLHFQLHNHPNSPWYHTRIRPKTADFLKKISSLYELHIVTFGARMYAHTIAKFLDPETKYFSHRILSRDECFDSRSKTANLSSLFPCGDHMVCIIDDREDVWNFAPNLVHVKPYIFFKNVGDINAPPGSKDLPPKKSESKASEDPPGPERRVERRQSIDMPNVDEEEDKKAASGDDAVSMVSDDLELSDDEDEDKPSSKVSKKKEEENSSEDTKGSTEEDDLVEVEDHDDYLPYLEDILKNIHKAYYTMYDQMLVEQCDEDTPIDLKTVIPYVKRKVLQGTNIVFSGVVPTHISLEKSKAFLVAKSLGAKVQDNIIEGATGECTTHLVAARTGTAKVNQARKINDDKSRKQKIHLVTPDWLWCCAERWEKAEEAVFPLYKSAPVTLKPPAHCSSPEIAFAERCPAFREEDSLDPFLAFSDEDLKGMDAEVEEMLTSESSESENEEEPKKKVAKKSPDLESSDEDSLTGEMPKGQKQLRKKAAKNEDSEEDSSVGEDEERGPMERFRRGEELPSDYEIASQSDDDNENDDDDELGAQLEREFLKDCSSRSSFTNE